MVKPWTAFPIKGVIWYQGEANVGRSEQYEDLFPALITDWRRQWRSDFPFYFVQLANFMESKDCLLYTSSMPAMYVCLVLN